MTKRRKKRKRKPMLTVATKQMGQPQLQRRTSVAPCLRRMTSRKSRPMTTMMSKHSVYAV